MNENPCTTGISAMICALRAALVDLIALVENEGLDASVGDDKFVAIVRARAVVREAVETVRTQ